MHKRSLLLLLLSFYCFSAFPQDTDSIVFVRSNWSKKRIAPKTTLLKHHFDSKNLFASNQNISYLEVKNKGNAPVFEIGSEVSVLKPTSAFGIASGAKAAINGTFFDVKNGGSLDFIKVKGRVINETRLEKNNSRAKHQEAAVVIQDGKLSLKKWNGSPDWEHTLTDENIMVTGPLLRIDNADETLDSGAFSTTRHPRTAIGIKPNGRVILLTVDGRNANSAGMSLFELRKIMKWLGCTSAINLDGGGSTTLWIQGFPDNGVINYPTDNKLWDHAGERKVANVILLKKKP
jgi:exopolysaccharide biosynthesis protein